MGISVLPCRIQLPHPVHECAVTQLSAHDIDAGRELVWGKALKHACDRYLPRGGITSPWRLLMLGNTVSSPGIHSGPVRDTHRVVRLGFIIACSSFFKEVEVCVRHQPIFQSHISTRQLNF